MLPGGKGINVSIVLSNLGVENTALYFAAGFVGDEITRRVEESGIRAEVIPVEEGCSRINVKLASIDGTELQPGAQAHFQSTWQRRKRYWRFIEGCKKKEDAHDYL